MAQLAGMPKQVVQRADLILKDLESRRGESETPTRLEKSTDEKMQLSFFQLDDPTLESIREELKRVDVNNLTPVEALLKLNEIKKLVGQ